jgi:hypothetical protein
MRNVLLFASHKTSVRTMAPLGQYFAGHVDLNPVLVLMLSDRNRDLDVGELGYDHILFYKNREITPGLEPNPGSPTLKRTRVLSPGLRTFLEYTLWLLTIRQHIKQLSAGFKFAGEIIDRYRPAALVLPDDRTYQLLPFIKAAREQRIPTIVVPVSFSNQTGVSIRRENRRAHQASGSRAPLVNRLVAKNYPRQVHVFQGKRLLFYGGLKTMALANGGMLPENPWVLGGGSSDYLLVDGYDARDQAISLGVPTGKITVSGHISHDDLFARYTSRERIRGELVSKYNLDAGKKLLICAVPHLAEHGMISWDKHWKDVDALVSILTSIGQNTLLSLHPKSDVAQYRYLEQKYNCKIAEENLDEIIVSAWLFIAGYSSTVRWAALSAIPAIVLDFNSLGYTLFDDWRGVIKVNSPQELQIAVNRTLQNSGYLKELIEFQQQVSNKLTIFDGKARERIVQFIAACISDEGGNDLDCTQSGLKPQASEARS